MRAMDAVTSLFAVGTGRTEDEMTTDIPPEITTPDSVETRIGTLKFFHGFGDDKTTSPGSRAIFRTILMTGF